MTRSTLFLASLFCMALGACGGDDVASDGGGVDAGPDAGPLITSGTAAGVYPAAEQMAKALLPDVVLYQIQGQRITAATGEVDTTTNQSYWRFTFLDLGLGKVIYALYVQGEFTITGPNDMNTETAKTISTAWIDSSDALTRLQAAGLQPPADANTRIDMQLAMFVGNPMDFRNEIAEPIWRVFRISAPPGMTPITEEWQITYWSGMAAYLICPPSGMCTTGP